MNSNANEHELTGPHDVRNPEVTFESRDLSARGVVGFLIALAVLGVILHVSLWGVYKYLSKSDFAGQPTTNPMTTSNRQLQRVGGDPAVTFPMPRLQPDPAADMNKFVAREQEILNSYGWVDQAAGKVHIPIEQAIDLVAKTGLPTATAAGNKAGPQQGNTPTLRFAQDGAPRGIQQTPRAGPQPARARSEQTPAQPQKPAP